MNADQTAPEPLNDHGRWVFRGHDQLGQKSWSWTENPSAPTTRPGPALASRPAGPETASERPSEAAGSPRHDPIGTVRIGRDGRYVVKVDGTTHGWYSPDGRRHHHNEVSGLRVVQLGEEASERPNEGRELAPCECGWYAAWWREHDRANAAELDRNAATARASSWWEAAKALCRSDRDHHAEIADLTSRADAAEAKLREEQIASTELYGRVFTALGLSIADPWHGLVEAAANVRAERDEARAKLDEIRAVLADALNWSTPPGPGSLDAVGEHHTKTLDRVLAIVAQPVKAAFVQNEEADRG